MQILLIQVEHMNVSVIKLTRIKLCDKKKAGRPSASRRTVTNEEALTTQSKARTYDKKLCIIFQRTGESCI